MLVSTSTLAWGVNFPAHLVVIKGTEYFDGKTRRYVDFPVTDVLQMMGRAGRPQFDASGVAMVLVHEPKKSFYRKFLYEPFPVESCLQEQLHDHLNAEIVTKTVESKQDAVDYITWTFLYRRLTQNANYYNIQVRRAAWQSCYSLYAFISQAARPPVVPLARLQLMADPDRPPPCPLPLAALA